MTIKIEKGIPLPGARKSEIRLAMEKMKVGDSFEIERDSVPPERLWLVGKKAGIKIATRQVGVNARRIWRTE